MDFVNFSQRMTQHCGGSLRNLNDAAARRPLFAFRYSHKYVRTVHIDLRHRPTGRFPLPQVELYLGSRAKRLANSARQVAAPFGRTEDRKRLEFGALARA